MNEIFTHFLALVSITVLDISKSIVLYCAGWRQIGCSGRYALNIPVPVRGETKELVLPREFAAEAAEKWLRQWLS